MTLDQIETFLTVADEGSFKAAAEVLHRSQPALSVAVKKLEEELGIQLFSREQYRPELTPQGKAFYLKAQEFFKQAQGLESFGRQLGMGEEPEVSVAFDGLCPLQFILNSISPFSREHPDTRLNLSFEILGGAIEKVDRGEVHLAVSPRIEIDGKNLEIKTLGTVNMIPVISGNALSQDSYRDLSLQMLKDIPQIIVRDSSRTPNFRTYGVLKGARQWSVQDMPTKREIICSGMGWGRLPEHMIKEDLQRGILKEVELDDMKREEIEVCLLRSHVHPMGPLGQKLWDNLLSSPF